MGSKSSDLYSLGMLMVALFNGGQSLIQANYSTNLYFKQAGMVGIMKIKEAKTLITGICSLFLIKDHHHINHNVLYVE